MDMNSIAESAFPFARLSAGQFLDSKRALERLDYCLEWRPWIWRKPSARLLCPFERFRGKRVLEIGARFGKMSCLMASCGATVTGVDIAAKSIGIAESEAAKWGVQDRVRFVAYDGNGRNLPEGPFDIVFSKSVLVLIPKEKLPDLLEQIQKRLAPNGTGLFLENANNWFLDRVRRHVVHRGGKKWNIVYWGFYPENLAILERALGPLRVKRSNLLVWSIESGREIAMETSVA